ncbi:major facilitator superfamily domain-containing protein [Obelidium mucronatum]|nr:major facilitator superfamily domain-containing protein [Obelidium mucronatum]
MTQRAEASANNDATAAAAACDTDAPLVPLDKIRFTLVVIGLILAVVVGSLDFTIVAPILKPIVAEFSQQDLVPWIGSSYLMMSASSGIFCGKLSNVFGREAVFTASMLFLAVGSLVSALSQNMETLIVGRALAGFGAGGNQASILIILTDLVTFQQRGKYQSLVGATLGLSSIFGPLIGGAIADRTTWRWCFYINLPVLALSIGLVLFSFKTAATPSNAANKRKSQSMNHLLAQMDWSGIALIFAAILCFITPLQLGGSIWEWKSPQVIILFILSGILTAAAIYNEFKAAHPILPPAMFSNPNVGLLTCMTVCTGATYFTTTYYTSLFFQVVRGNTATEAGAALAPLLGGMVVATVFIGAAVSRTGNYAIWFRIGPLFLVTGIVLTAHLNADSSLPMTVFSLLLLGLGFGCVFQTRVVGLQASAPPEYVAIVSSVASTAVILGGAIGVSVTGTIINNQVSHTSPALLKVIELVRASNISSGSIDAALKTQEVLGMFEFLKTVGEKAPAFANLTNDAMGELVASFNSAYRISYLALLPAPILTFVLAVLFLKNYHAAKTEK